MKVIGLKDAQKIPVTMQGAVGVFKQLPLSAADGSPMFSFRVFTIQPGGYTPFHDHPFEHLNYVIEGSGVLVQESGRELALYKGEFALVLPHEKHQYRNSSGSDPFIMICAVPKQYE
jgi:quercetin dioxygenase-like cupin family protein